MGAEQAQQGIRVRVKFFPLAFLLYFFKPRLCLDGGEPQTVPWGETLLPAAPGHHQVRCYVPYLYLRHMGDSTIDVDVAPGGTADVQWRAPLVIFLKGKWSGTPTPQAAS
jgi:hypothetical protein